MGISNRKLNQGIAMYYIVPALTDQAGQCRIVFREGFTGSARDDYRSQPDAWSDVGLMNSRGQLVCLQAPAQVAKEFKDCEPLMAGMQIDEMLLEEESARPRPKY